MIDPGCGSKGDRSVFHATYILVREVDIKSINK